jgi:protein-S-isoprenylcysteine O-methyltransferase Ste14
MGIGLLALAALTAHVSRRAERDYRERGQLTTATSVAGWSAYALHGHLFRTSLRRGRPLPLPRLPAGIGGAGLAASGAGLYVAGVSAFDSFDQLSGRTNEGLVTEGAFRYSRNPQNVGAGLFLAGVALITRRGLALLLALAFWLAFLRYARVEEEHLERVYGEAYRRYRNGTPRLLGLPATSLGR